MAIEKPKCVHCGNTEPRHPVIVEGKRFGTLRCDTFEAAPNDADVIVTPEDHEEHAREELREIMQLDIDQALERQRPLFLAAARWLALEEFLTQADGVVSLVLIEHDENTDSEPRKPTQIPGARVIAAEFPDKIGIIDVKNQLDNFVDDLMLSISIENKRRNAERETKGDGLHCALCGFIYTADERAERHIQLKHAAIANLFGR